MKQDLDNIKPGDWVYFYVKNLNPQCQYPVPTGEIKRRVKAVQHNAKGLQCVFIDFATVKDFVLKAKEISGYKEAS